MRSEQAARWPRLGGLMSLVLGLLQVMGSTGYDRNAWHQHAVHLDALAYALLLIGPVALLFRLRHPIGTLAVVVTVTTTYVLLGYVAGPVWLSEIVAVIAAVTAGRRRAAWVVCGAGYVVLNVLALLAPLGPIRVEDWTLGNVGISLSFLLLFLTVAELVRIRRERAAEAAHVRAEETLRRASEERLRIARELHDVLAHNISMINVQAGVALHLLDERPEQARTALAAIKDASKEALTEVRSVLGVLRQVDEKPPRTPAAGLERLEELISRARAAGLTVRVETRGDPLPLPSGVDLAAFRIVQESLTNVTRHAGPGATATVQVTYAHDDLLLLRISDDGRGAPGDAMGGGSGIIGMRERVSALGGDLVTGPRPGGGFRVQARLPLKETK